MYGFVAEPALSTVLLMLVATGGDELLAVDFSYEKRAIIDNTIHGITGILTWHIISTLVPGLIRTRQILEMFLCGILASAIDLDHFAAARSYRIRVTLLAFMSSMMDAIDLRSRPPLHCTSLTVGPCALGLVLAHLCHWLFVERICWLVIAAIISHHLRDAARRGLWLYPFGSTPPLPYSLYLLATVLLPYVLAALFNWTRLQRTLKPLSVSLV